MKKSLVLLLIFVALLTAIVWLVSVNKKNTSVYPAQNQKQTMTPTEDLQTVSTDLDTVDIDSMDGDINQNDTDSASL